MPSDGDALDTPNVDVASVRTVRCGDRKVAVGQMADGRYVASVVSFKRSAIGQAFANAFGGDGTWASVEGAPQTTRDRKWVAVGAAVDEFNEQDEDKEHHD